ncbi:MAG TPA: hypothetical protein VN748_10515 [Pseudonocardiaceae bacterium]|nr:hypothetical protein [Pseudonocardiaceae bacterium]
MSVGSVHPAPQSDPAGPAGSLEAPVRSEPAPVDPAGGTADDECRVAGGAPRLGGLGRSVAPAAGTAAARGSVVASTAELGTPTTGIGSTAEGSGAEVSGAVVSGAEEAATGTEGVTGGAETAGTGTSTVAGRPERRWAVMISMATAPPVRTKHPPAATSLPQRRRSLARRRKSSHGSAPASSGIPADGSGAWIGAALVTASGLGA